MAKWWQQGIIYQIYPRSFQDSNDDGIGDLPGIIQRLDYLQWLGIDAVWISPVFASPMKDFGYDVSSYREIHPIFGTLGDMEQLIEEAHSRNIRVLLDFVPNHTSDQHRWFIESRASRDNPKRDWYVWKDPAPDGGPPNNWLSRFDGESAWEFDEATGQYYLHSFLVEQPDLNWRNPDLREAMLDNMCFWFDRGVDGFRVDVSYRTMKDPEFRDNPPNPDWEPGMDPQKKLIEKYNKNHEDIHQFNRWLREVADEYEDRVLVGEINVDLENLVKHYGTGDEFHLPFNFRLIYSPWEADAVQEIADRYDDLLPEHAWPNWVLGNHDKPRFASRTSPAQARVGMMALLTLRGTPTVYYGEEIAMQNGDIPPDEIKDPWGKFAGPEFSRDPERTPMQWDATPNAGFTSEGVEPWLPLADPSNNVAEQRHNVRSMLSLTLRLIEMRRGSQALTLGDYASYDGTPEGVFAYKREAHGEVYIIALNLTDKGTVWEMPEEAAGVQFVLSTHLDQPDPLVGGTLRLRPDEGVVLRVK